ncbi:MAG: zinc-ribbon domain-containing protein [Actinobacteria bacterium]|nr:zinc-ribbon domain-containing protein [Actinomycetota bacterium]
MGLSDRIFRRKTAGTGAPQAAQTMPPTGPVDAGALPSDATVVIPPPSSLGQTEPVDGATAILAPHAEPVAVAAPPVPEQQPVTDAAQADAPHVVHGAGPMPPVPRPGFRERGRLRRRLRYLRQVRELGYRDLGGLVFDQHRFERRDERLVEAKVLAIETLDREIRAIEEVLQLHTPYSELFIPGVGACARCGTLHQSDANFCPNCGLSFGGPRSVAGMAGTDSSGAAQGHQPLAAPNPDPYNQQPGSGPPA